MVLIRRKWPAAMSVRYSAWFCKMLGCMKETIGDNIRFGKLDATDYEVVDAAKTANVDHFIRTMPDGYEMFINSEGDNISLGQNNS